MMTLIIVGIVVFAFLGAPMFAILSALAMLGAAATQPDMSIAQAFAGALVRVFHLATSAEGSTLATIPLFTFMGYVLAEAKTAERLVGFATAVFGWVPGGLAIVTVGVAALFTTVTGASGVTIVAVGGLLLPAMLKQGYSERFSLGLITSTGSIGLLFPPALPLIIYGIIYGVTAQAMAAGGGGPEMELVDFDLARFLFAGIVPGLVLLGAVALYAVYVAVRHKVPRSRFEPRAAVTATIRALPELLIPVLMLGALLLGMVIPEAAAITALYVIILETLIYRDVKLRALPRVSREALQLVGAIFILIVAATALTDHFVYARIPERLTGWMTEHIHSKYTFLIALNVLLLLVGVIMEIYSALLIVVPLIAPAAMVFDIDPYHLGIIFLINLEIGYITPPVGLNLFISSFRFRKQMGELYWSIIPFGLVMLAVLLVVTYVPALTPIKARKTDSAHLAEPAAGAMDAGVAVTITWPDGGVWTPERCEAPEIRGDVIEYAECRNLFSSYERCGTKTEPLDRIECEQAVLDGEDPFEEAPAAHP
jgi:C4-dicarboxylate transporter, DctM subunit